MRWPYSKSPPAGPRCWCWVATMCRGASGCSWAPSRRGLSVTSCAAGGCSRRLASPPCLAAAAVMVALDGETAPAPALTLAFEEARLRDARLIVLHAEPISASARDVDRRAVGPWGCAGRSGRKTILTSRSRPRLCQATPTLSSYSSALRGCLGGWPPTPAWLGIVDQVRGPKRDDADTLPTCR